MCFPLCVSKKLIDVMARLVSGADAAVLHHRESVGHSLKSITPRRSGVCAMTHIDAFEGANKYGLCVRQRTELRGACI